MTEVTQPKPEDRYRDLFENIPIGLYATGPDGQILEANPAMVTMLGYPDKESLLRTNIKDIYVQPDDYPSQHAMVDQDGIVRGYEIQLHRYDGESIWVKDSFRAVKDRKGDLHYFEGSLEDITAYKNAREALRRSEHLFRSLFENASDAIFLMNLEGVHLMGNQQAADMLGYARDELVGMSMKDIVAPQEHSKAMDRLATLLAGQSLPVYERRFRRKNREEFTVEINASLVRDMEGKPLLIQSIVRDITQRKEAELRIQNLTRLYATLSQINQTIVRVADQTELISSICKVAVEHGKFGLAWIGLVDRELGDVTPVAVHGAVQDRLPFQTINLKEAPFENGLMAKAFRSGQIAYSRDIQTDPSMGHWVDMAASGSFHAAAAVPFRLMGDIFGLLNLYATDVDFFEDEGQHELLNEMALDISFALDNMEREKRRQQAERERARLWEVIEHSLNEIYLFDAETLNFQFVNKGALRNLGYTIEEMMEMTPLDLKPEFSAESFSSLLQPLLLGEKERHIFETVHRRADGSIYPVGVFLQLTGVDEERLFLAVINDITERKLAMDDLRKSEERYRTTLDNMLEGCQIIGFDWRYLYVNEALARHGRRKKAELLGNTMMEAYPGIENTDLFTILIHCMVERIPGHLENEFTYPDGSSGWFEVSVEPVPEGIFILSVDITERKQAEMELRKAIRALKVLSAGNQAVIRAKDERELLEDVCRVILEVGHYRFAWVGWAEQDEAKTVRPVAHAGFEQGYLQTTKHSWADDDVDYCLTGNAIRSAKPAIVRNILSGGNSLHWRDEAVMLGYRSIIALPLMEDSHAFGALTIYAGEEKAFDQEEVELLKELADDLAHGILTLRTRARRNQAEAKVRRQLESLAALRAIDLAITSSLDLRVIFDVLLDKVTNQLSIDAAGVLLLNQHTQILEFVAGRGFRTTTFQKTKLRYGEGYAGQAAMERRIIHVQNLQKRETDFLRIQPFAAEGFTTYFAVPLEAKGHIKGVLEVYHRTDLEPDQEWLDFLWALAGQAAIALDNAGMFDDLQRSNVELTLAYDTTIEGWSRALDLRDRETEGHSRRVTDITIELGRKIGMSEAELIHARRGALLHDIGKMGIPDTILLKPGSLSEEEWAIMKMHPVNAYKLLSPIAYLRPALDIPYCHHEKWDGSGYPRGLKGEEIPLAARIFAIVDVWDALRSDRPYRPAWSEEKALEYIRSNSGSHFDPRVVEVFMEFIGGTEV